MRRMIILLTACWVASGGFAGDRDNTYRGLTEVYSANRQQGVGNFVTRDFVLLAYSGAIEKAAADEEKRVAIPLTRQLIGGLAKRASSAAGGTAKANRAFLDVIAGLLKGVGPVEAGAATEYKLVLAAGGVQQSGIAHQQIDYTQFRPRGWYTGSEDLSRYFRAVRYAGTVLFYVRESKATGISAADADALTEQALQLSRWIRSDDLAATYRRLDRHLEALFGPADDLRAGDLALVRTQGRKTAAVRADLVRLANNNGRTPRILGGSVDTAQLEPGLTAREALTGWRLLPLRFTADSAAMQELVFDSVTDYLGTGSPFSAGTINGRQVKAFPLSAELLALLGSKDAAARLDKSGDTNYKGYKEGYTRASRWLASASGPTQAMFAPMRDLAASGDAKSATAALALWTHYRHANLLYVKQSYTAESKSFEIPRPRSAAYLEPATVLYRQLLRQALLLPVRSAIPELVPLLERCVEISVTEDAKRPLTGAQIRFLNEMDLTVRKLAGDADSPMVVDVHTSPSSKEVLEEGVGLVLPEALNIALPGAGKQVSLAGARWTHKEFKQPMDKRLTDQEWEKKNYAEAIPR